MEHNRESICKTALGFFGEKNQVIAAIEELNELSVELAKIATGKSNPRTMTGDMARLVDELADVQIMIGQICLAFEISRDDIAAQMDFKAMRLGRKIDQLTKPEPGGES